MVDMVVCNNLTRLAGPLVPAHVRSAGEYLVCPRLRASPFKSISHCLGRKDSMDRYFILKILILVMAGKESQDENVFCYMYDHVTVTLSILNKLYSLKYVRSYFRVTFLESKIYFRYQYLGVRFFSGTNIWESDFFPVPIFEIHFSFPVRSFQIHFSFPVRNFQTHTISRKFGEK